MKRFCQFLALVVVIGFLVGCGDTKKDKEGTVTAPGKVEGG